MSYSSLMNHAPMLFDEVRNRAYLEAMRAVISPDSVVLDLGAGAGVLGLLAAKAGARRVYCVEPASVAAHITALAKANGVADRITVLRGRIEDLELPEQVDVLLSVFTGNLLFTEDLLPSLYHARDRWLKPGGVMIPDRARLLFAAVEAEEHYRDLFGKYHAPSLDLDYSALAPVAVNGLFLLKRDVAPASPVTDSVCVAELDLRTTHESSLRWQAQRPALRDGIVHGLLGWIEIHLGEAWLSTSMDSPAVHWHPTLLPLAAPLAVTAGELLKLSFRHLDNVQVYWSVEAESGAARHSTVLGNPDHPIELMLSSPGCVTPPNADAELVHVILGLMREGKSNRAIAEEVQRQMPHRFRDERDAIRRVGALAARYRSHPVRGD